MNKKYKNALFVTSIFALCLAILFRGCKTFKSTSKEEIKIGVICPLTGSVAKYGTYALNGTELFIDEYNEDSENRIKIKLIKYDDEGEAVKSVDGYNYLIDQGVTAIINSTTSTPALSISKMAYDDKKPMVVSIATSDWVTFDKKNNILYENVFRTSVIDKLQGVKMANFAKDSLKAKTASVLYSYESAYSEEVKESFVKQAEELGIKILQIEKFAENAVDFKTQLSKISSTNSDIIFIPHYYETVSLILNQAEKLGIKSIMLGSDGWSSVSKLVSESKIKNSYYLTGFCKEDSNNASRIFCQNYEKKFGTTPDTFSANGYDSAKILTYAIINAINKNPKISALNLNSEIIKELKNTNLECITGNIKFDEFNNSVKDVYIFQINFGKESFFCKY